MAAEEKEESFTEIMMEMDMEIAMRPLHLIYEENKPVRSAFRCELTPSIQRKTEEYFKEMYSLHQTNLKIIELIKECKDEQEAVLKFDENFADEPISEVEEKYSKDLIRAYFEIKEDTNLAKMAQPYANQEKIELARQLGFDYGTYGSEVPEEIDSLEPTLKSAFIEEYEIGLSRRKKGSKASKDFCVRKWLGVRKNALLRSRIFGESLTLDAIRECAAIEYCPITGYRMIKDHDDPQAHLKDYHWSIERQNNDLGYVKNNLTSMCTYVNKARGTLGGGELLARAAGEIEDDRLTRLQWGRLFFTHLDKLALTCGLMYMLLHLYPSPYIPFSLALRTHLYQRKMVIAAFLTGVRKKGNIGIPPDALSYFIELADTDKKLSPGARRELSKAMGPAFMKVLKNDSLLSLNLIEVIKNPQHQMIFACLIKIALQNQETNQGIHEGTDAQTILDEGLGSGRGYV